MKNINIDGGREFDWGYASKDYAAYRDIYPAEFFEKIVNLGLCVKGQHVLDLGTGTGVIPRGMYKYGAKFTGVDIAANQIAEAKQIAAQNDMDIQFMVMPAEDIAFPPDSFDVITACQCFVYFNANILAPKMHNVLRRGGHFVKTFMAWLAFENHVAYQTEKLVLKYSPCWTDANYTRSEIETPAWTDGLFRVREKISYDVNIPFTRESWRGRIRACRGVGASLSPAQVQEFDRELEELMQCITPDQVFDIPHNVTMLVLESTK